MVKAKDALKSIELLKERGYAIPDALKTFVETKVNEGSNLAQVWRCPYCPYKYDSVVKITAVSHSCPKRTVKQGREIPLILVWERSA